MPEETVLLADYETMLVMRRFEEKAGQLYGMGLIGGFCHLYIGQEAVVAGLQPLKRPEDTVITSYRDHAHMLACGMDPRAIMAELTGRSTGSSRGKGGSMHMFSREKGFYGGHGIVGAQIALGTGLAFAHRYRKDGGVAFVYFGDGAANQGQMYESFNMAALWNLPVLYIIENNRYSMGTSLARGCAGPNLYGRGAPFGIPGQATDGMDVYAVREAARTALDHVRAGRGPWILEMDTYRFRGHSMSDPARYRTREEVEKMKQEHDPLVRLKTLLVEHWKTDEAVFRSLEQKVRGVVQEAASFAETSPLPDPGDLWTDVCL